jgi:hypothetical protein
MGYVFFDQPKTKQISICVQLKIFNTVTINNLNPGNLPHTISMSISIIIYCIFEHYEFLSNVVSEIFVIN